MSFWHEVWEGYKKRAWIAAAALLACILFAAVVTLIGGTP